MCRLKPPPTRAQAPPRAPAPTTERSGPNTSTRPRNCASGAPLYEAAALASAALTLIRPILRIGLIRLIGLVPLALTLILATLGALAIGLVASVLPLVPALLALVTLTTLVTLLLPTLPLILSLLVIHCDLQASRLTGVMARRLACAIRIPLLRISSLIDEAPSSVSIRTVACAHLADHVRRTFALRAREAMAHTPLACHASHSEATQHVEVSP
jgi:hypothetical protein